VSTLNHLNHCLQHFGRGRKVRYGLFETTKRFLVVNLDQLILRQVHDRIGRARGLCTGTPALV
jgi:hypothetical protein